MAKIIFRKSERFFVEMWESKKEILLISCPLKVKDITIPKYVIYKAKRGHYRIYKATEYGINYLKNNYNYSTIYNSNLYSNLQNFLSCFEFVDTTTNLKDARETANIDCETCY